MAIQPFVRCLNDLSISSLVSAKAELTKGFEQLLKAQNIKKSVVKPC
jgi:hypothetical protein